MIEDKVYIGDGVYARAEFYWGGFSVVLTTEDGISVQNTIVLEPSVFQQLLAVSQKWRKHLEDETTRKGP